MKTYLSVIVVALSLVFPLGLVQAQSDYPNKSITLIMVQPAGGTGDLTARLIAKLAEKHLGQPVIVVNKVGGSGTVGTAAWVASKPDGYTIGTMGQSPFILTPHLIKLSYHPIKDADPIIQYGINNFAVSVRYDSPFMTFKDVIDYARKTPGVLTYGTSGVNSVVHITIEKIARDEKVEMIHVPYKGGPEAITAAMGGHVTMAAGDISASLLKAKKLRLLAIFPDQRWDEFPEVPTIKDLGYNIPIPYFVGLGAPRGTPEPIMNKLEDAFTKAVKDPEFAPAMKNIGIPVFYRNRKDFTAYVVKGYETVGKALDELKK
jgi:tripartite-type tricarboxylate transporter receptor subunit TctC